MHTYQFDLSGGANTSLAIAGRDGFSAVWYRRTKATAYPKTGLSKGEWLNLVTEYNALLENIVQTLSPLKWLSRPSSIYRAENKIYQLINAASLQFNVPDWIVSNVYETVETFIAQHGAVIIKPLKNGRINDDENSKLIYTNRLTEEIKADLRDFELTPCIIQKEIPKAYELRITVVDGKVFAAKVNSQEDPETIVDWRRKKLKFERYELPEKVAQQCISLTEKLGLSFGAIDMIRGADGEFYFLEINPNGQWAWIEIDTELPISDHIIKFLTSDEV
ncbi:hypothetical protein [uncultured Pedobacter sp.]|uniref:hypothetical protein n=1 Tax=uncultured Pedobacter sp. TaxID=246139 RepID=UPI002610F246|nr:hypothetical protein [uncultured Pedobacter sp.]